jgi:hypothetical protein
MQQPGRAGVIPQLDADNDIHALAAEQGVLPFEPKTPMPDFWPEDESADEFLTFLREVRRDSSENRTRP